MRSAVHRGVPLAVLVLAASCLSRPAPTAAAEAPSAGTSELDVQAVVLEMADDYIAALGEAVYLADPGIKDDTRARWLIQSFLRNGVGATLDIATGPNPDVAILDMLVLVSLQARSFEKHWMSTGIGEYGATTLERLQQADIEMWTKATRVLSEEQLTELRSLIAAWIEANPDRTVVSLVRFEEFTEARTLPQQEPRKRALKLLQDIGAATSAVEDVRLLGERLLWFAGRYPYVLGEQAELTVYRLADQPEFRDLAEALGSFDRLTEAVGDLAERLPADPLEAAESSLSRLTTQAVTETFDRIADEKIDFLNELESRQESLGPLLQEIRETVRVTGELSEKLTRTTESVESVVSHFQPDPATGREPLRLEDLRDAAVELGKTAELLTVLLDRTNETLRSEELDEKMRLAEAASTGLINYAFWRGLILVLVLLGGLALIRRIPRPSRR